MIRLLIFRVFGLCFLLSTPSTESQETVKTEKNFLRSLFVGLLCLRFLGLWRWCYGSSHQHIFIFTCIKQLYQAALSNLQSFFNWMMQPCNIHRSIGGRTMIDSLSCCFRTWPCQTVENTGAWLAMSWGRPQSRSSSGLILLSRRTWQF